jgi:phosphoserine phosphatase
LKGSKEDLVIQGDNLARINIEHIAAAAGASARTRVAPDALRLHKVTRGVAAEALLIGVDYAYVPSERRLSDFGLVAMDMDSTLITIECIDEIADMQGIKPQVAAITASAMRGEIDFPESLRRRVALLEGLDESALQRVYDERLKLSPGAEAMLTRLKGLGIRTLLVSGGFTFFTERLKNRLGLDYTLSNTLDIANGKLTGKVRGDIVDAQAKAAKLCEVRDSLGLAKDQVIALGDGANDLPMLAEAGVSIAYHAKPVVREKATFSFNHVGLDGLLNLYI